MARAGVLLAVLSGACALVQPMPLHARAAFVQIEPAERAPRTRIPRTPYPDALYPDQSLPFPEGFTLNAQAGAVTTGRDIQRPGDVGRAIQSCWNAPRLDKRQEITIRLSFNRAGSVIGEPRITYAGGSELNEGEKGRLRASILKAVVDCAPLRFTPALASAIAGRPFAIRFVAPASGATK